MTFLIKLKSTPGWWLRLWERLELNAAGLGNLEPGRGVFTLSNACPRGQSRPFTGA